MPEIKKDKNIPKLWASFTVEYCAYVLFLLFLFPLILFLFYGAEGVLLTLFIIIDYSIFIIVFFFIIYVLFLLVRFKFNNKKKIDKKLF